MSLTLAPTKRYFGLGDKNDCILREGRRVVGRIMFSQHAPPGHQWFWAITARGVIATDARAYAATREQAMKDFKARWLIWTALGINKNPGVSRSPCFLRAGGDW